MIKITKDPNVAAEDMWSVYQTGFKTDVLRENNAATFATNTYDVLLQQGYSPDRILKMTQPLLISLATTPNSNINQYYENFKQERISAREANSTTAANALAMLNRDTSLWSKYGHYARLDWAVQGLAVASQYLPGLGLTTTVANRLGLLGGLVSLVSVDSLCKGQFNDFYNTKSTVDARQRALCELTLYSVHINRAINADYKAFTDKLVAAEGLPLKLNASGAELLATKGPLAFINNVLVRHGESLSPNGPAITSSEWQALRTQMVDDFAELVDKKFFEEELKRQVDSVKQEKKQKIDDMEAVTQLSLHGILIAAQWLGVPQQTIEKIKGGAALVHLTFEIARFAAKCTNYIALASALLSAAEYISNALFFDGDQQANQFARIEAQYEQVQKELAFIKYSQLHIIFDLDEIKARLGNLQELTQLIHANVDVLVAQARHDVETVVVRAHNDAARIRGGTNSKRDEAYCEVLARLSGYAIVTANAAPVFNLKPGAISRGESVDLVFCQMREFVRRYGIAAEFDADLTRHGLPNIYQWCFGSDFFAANYLEGLNANPKIIFNEASVAALCELHAQGTWLRNFIVALTSKTSLKKMAAHYHTASSAVKRALLNDFLKHVSFCYERFIHRIQTDYGTQCVISQDIFLEGLPSITVVPLQKSPYVAGFYDIIRNASTLSQFNFIERAADGAGNQVILYGLPDNTYNPFLHALELGIIQVENMQQPIGAANYRRQYYYYEIPITIKFIKGPFAGFTLAAKKIVRANKGAQQAIKFLNVVELVDYTFYDFASTDWRTISYQGATIKDVHDIDNFMVLMRGMLQAYLSYFRAEVGRAIRETFAEYIFQQGYSYISAFAEVTTHFDMIAKLDHWRRHCAMHEVPKLDADDFTLRRQPTLIHDLLLDAILQGDNNFSAKKEKTEAALTALFNSFSDSRYDANSEEYERAPLLLEASLQNLGYVRGIVMPEWQARNSLVTLSQKHKHFMHQKDWFLYTTAAVAGGYSFLSLYGAAPSLGFFNTTLGRVSYGVSALVLSILPVVMNYKVNRRDRFIYLLRAAMAETNLKQKTFLFELAYLVCPQDAYGIKCLAHCYIAQGMRKEAQKLYDDALISYPEEGLLHVYHMEQFSSSDERAELIKKISNFPPDNANYLALALLHDSYSDNGNVLLTIGKMTDSVSEVSCADQQYYLVALCLLRSGKKTEALEQFSNAINACQFRQDLLEAIKNLLSGDQDLSKSAVLTHCAAKISEIKGFKPDSAPGMAGYLRDRLTSIKSPIASLTLFNVGLATITSGLTYIDTHNLPLSLSRFLLGGLLATISGIASYYQTKLLTGSDYAAFAGPIAHLNHYNLMRLLGYSFSLGTNKSDSAFFMHHALLTGVIACMAPALEETLIASVSTASQNTP